MIGLWMPQDKLRKIAVVCILTPVLNKNVDLWEISLILKYSLHCFVDQWH